MVFGRVVNFVKDGIQEMLIQRPDEHKSLIVYKHPENTVPTGAQLTVDADEAVVFFRDGSLVGALRTAGVGQRHTLTSQNIPFLGRIIDKATGGNIFVTDLYFVTMRPIYDQGFGGELGYVTDPILGIAVSPRIYGKFAFRVVDPEKFIINYVGLQGQQTNEQLMRWITGKFMNSVVTVMGEVMDVEQKSMLQLMRLQSQLAQTFLQRCPDLNDIGIAITDIGEFKVNLNDEDDAALKEAQAEIGASKRAIAKARNEAQARQFELDQDFQQDARYVQGLAGGDFGKYAAGRAMIGAGEGMAKGGGEGGGGGGMMQGAGIGAGFGMANAMMGAMGQQQPPQQAAPQAAAAPRPAAGAGMVSCPGCSATVPGGKFCAECGTSLSPKPQFCPSCGTQGAAGAKFCAECGTGFPA